MEIPRGLRDAAALGRLVPFVGAGASRIGGCPSWAEFADAVLEQIVAHGGFDFGQLDQIRSLDPKIKLSIARGLADDNQIRVDYRDILKPREKCVDKGKKLYARLSRLGRTFVTTNYDEWLDHAYGPEEPSIADSEDPQQPLPQRSRRVLYRKSDLIPENLQPNTVVHIHGSVLAPEEMILGTRDYVTHYRNDHRDPAGENRVLTFLDYLFNNRVILFVGYGLEEMEILEHVVRKAPSTEGPHEARHFLLQGFFSHESHLRDSLKRYYLKECGIELIAYPNDVCEVLDRVFANYLPHFDYENRIESLLESLWTQGLSTQVSLLIERLRLSLPGIAQLYNRLSQ